MQMQEHLEERQKQLKERQKQMKQQHIQMQKMLELLRATTLGTFSQNTG